MWMKVDDKLHTHRKTRRALRSQPDKRRDCAPLGLWVLAGSWCSQNGTEGWIPAEDLDRFDDDWEALTERLVAADYWWPEVRDGEPGFGFVDWSEYNGRERESDSGKFGNHLRWHVSRGVVKEGCEHCPQPPESAPLSPPDSPPISPPIRTPESDPNRPPESPNIAQPNPIPNPIPNPTPFTRSPANADEPHHINTDSINDSINDAGIIDADFADWWQHYPRKVGKGQALRAYRTARKKTDAATLIEAITTQTGWLLRSGPAFCPHASTWLNGERWQDRADAIAPPIPDRRQQATDDLFAQAAQRAAVVDNLTIRGELAP